MVSPDVRRVDAQHLAALLNRFVVSAAEIQSIPKRVMSFRGHRVKLDRTLRLPDGLLEPALVCQLYSITSMGVRIVRVQFEGPLQLALPTRPIEFTSHFNHGRSAVSFCQGTIQSEGFGSSFVGLDAIRFR